MFEDNFVEWKHIRDERKPVRIQTSKLSEFHELLDRYMLRRTAADAGLTLPTNEYADHLPRFVFLDGAQREAYEAVTHSGIIGRQKREQVALTRRGHETVPSVVVAAVADLETEFASDKALVFAEHLATVDVLEQELTAAGIGWVRIDGDVPPAQRAERLERFETDPSIRVLLGTRAVERGLNLQFCRVLLSVGCSDNPARERQREGRLCRIGSPHRTFVHRVYLPHTYESWKKVRSLVKKREVAHEVVVWRHGDQQWRPFIPEIPDISRDTGLPERNTERSRRTPEAHRAHLEQRRANRRPRQPRRWG